MRQFLKYVCFLAILAIPCAVHAGGGASMVPPGVVIINGTPSGGTIGQTTGKTLFEGGANNVLWISSFPALTSGTVGYIHTYLQFGDSQSFTACLFDASGTILAYRNFGISGNGPSWYDGALNTTVSLTSGTLYYLGVVSNDTVWRMFYAASMTGYNTRSIAFAYTATPGNFVPGSSSISTPSAALTIYVNNSASSPP
jgi:hypothetical protein